MELSFLKVAKSGGALLLLLFVFGSGFMVRDNSVNREQIQLEQTLLSELATIQDDLTVVKNRNLDANKALQVSLQRNKGLADQLLTMDAAISELRFIVTSQGSIEPGTTEIITVPINIPAPSHLFQLSDGLVVAELRSTILNDEVTYEYPTYGLEFETSFVVTDKVASVDVTVSSTFDPDHKIRVVQETQSIKIKDQEHKMFEPNIGIGFSVSGPVPALQATIWSTFIHPTKDISLLGLRVSGNDTQVSLGVDAIYYNLGAPLPILTNTWIGAGASINQLGVVSGTITLGAKL